jgi:hypothetical protein
VSESVTMIKIFATNSRKIPFIHFIEIPPSRPGSRPVISGDSPVRMIILTDPAKCIPIEIMDFKITP